MNTSVWVFIIVCLVITNICTITYIVINQRNIKRELAKVQVMENHVSISQIRPHFLYNCLNSIYYLCDENPARAKEAISDFSEFLRDDLEALSGEHIVSFESELKHIKRYVNLEKMRFGELLNVEYDIQYENFTVPVLSIQPLVENAIKHGVGKKKEGGTVKIRSERHSKYVMVSVSDDGVGFDEGSRDYKKPYIDEAGKNHVGLSNVCARIIGMASGKVSIESTPGQGTEIKLYIPYEWDKK